MHVKDWQSVSAVVLAGKRNNMKQPDLSSEIHLRTWSPCSSGQGWSGARPCPKTPINLQRAISCSDLLFLEQIRQQTRVEQKLMTFFLLPNNQRRIQTQFINKSTVKNTETNIHNTACQFFEGDKTKPKPKNTSVWRQCLTIWDFHPLPSFLWEVCQWSSTRCTWRDSC